ncbi:hypothetical protein ACQ859_16395 [Roseateles chitinivorans]|uniref:hypothetical protein n=1 Tax=Roseateles chitinivorans TaxID=2917965 RepID=UPI003D66510C
MIIEAFRSKVWKALANHFSLETVACCVEECLSGDPLRPGWIPVDREELIGGLAAVHDVNDEMLAMLAIERPELPALDPGELHLLAWLNAHPQENVLTALSTADRAAARGTHVLGLLDILASLEELCGQAGVGGRQVKGLQEHFQEAWLSKLRLQLRTGVL